MASPSICRISGLSDLEANSDSNNQLELANTPGFLEGRLSVLNVAGTRTEPWRGSPNGAVAAGLQ